MLERMAVRMPRCLSCSCQASMAGFCVVHMRASQWLSSSTVAGVEIEAGFAQELLPEGDAGELAFVVGVAVGPVEGFEAVGGQAGDADHGIVRFGVWVAGQYHSVVEDHRAQSQCCPPVGARVWWRGAPASIVHDALRAG